jgi:hypothetical protein
VLAGDEDRRVGLVSNGGFQPSVTNVGMSTDVLRAIATLIDQSR